MVAVGVATARESVAEGDITARVRVAVEETAPREREIVAVSVAVGEIGCERVAVPLREIPAIELGVIIDDLAAVDDAEIVPAAP
jgi:hypothetical protein